MEAALTALPSVETLALLVAVVALAFTVEGALGFGATVIALTLGAFVVPMDTLLPALVPLNMVLSASIVWRSRRAVDRRWLLTRAVPLMALGMPLGMVAARSLDATLLVRSFGAFVCTIALFELMRRPLPLPAPALVLLGGVVHGAFGTGGPMVVAAAGRTLEDKTRFRGTLSALWLSLHVVLLSGFAHDGKLNQATALTVAALAVGVVPGIFVGEAVHRRVPVAAFRVVVWVVLGLAGLALISR